MKSPVRSLPVFLTIALLSAMLVTCHRNVTGHNKGGVIGSATVDGSITFGPLHDATVDLFSVTSTGANSTKLASAVTDLAGHFKLDFSVRPVGPVRVVVTGGVYNSEFDGLDVDLSTCSFSYLLDGLAGGVNKVSLTPVSDMVNALTLGLRNGGLTLKVAHDQAKSLLSKFFGFTGNVETVFPSFDGADIGTEEFKYSLVLGALETLASKLSPTERCALFTALSEDITDGLFDGTNGGVPVPLGTGNLPSTAGTTDFLGDLTVYATTGKSITDQEIDISQLLPTISEIKKGVSDSPLTPPSTGISAGSSGAISTLAFDGKQWVFVAARTAGVVAIDVTDPVATNPTINVYSDLFKTTFNGIDIGGVIPLVGADHPQLLVFAYQSKHCALVNAATGAVEFETDLAIQATSTVNFSGGSAFIAGGIPDTARDGVWLATADGYYFFNRLTQQLETLFPVDCPHMLAENLGGDISHDMLFCPNYQDFNHCTVLKFGGVQLVDLAANKSYYMDDTAFDTIFRTKGLDFPDAGSVDGKFQIGIITNEDSADVGFVNLATIARTDNTPPTLSTFAPAAVDGAVYMNLGTGFSPTLSGSAVDSNTHLVLFMAGFSNDIAVGQLQSTKEAGAGKWAGLKDWRYNTLSSYNEAHDPHAVAALTNLSNSKSYGYLLDGSNTRVLQVDLAAFLAETPASGGDGHRVDVDLVTDGVIINRDWIIP